MKKETTKVELRDDENPQFIFSMTHSSLLIDIANGKIDAIDYAKKELANRGIGKSGTWVGFAQAAKVWEVGK